jgi:hypothetical protein
MGNRTRISWLPPLIKYVTPYRCKFTIACMVARSSRQSKRSGSRMFDYLGTGRSGHDEVIDLHGWPGLVTTTCWLPDVAWSDWSSFSWTEGVRVGLQHPRRFCCSLPSRLNKTKSLEACVPWAHMNEAQALLNKTKSLEACVPWAHMLWALNVSQAADAKRSSCSSNATTRLPGFGSLVKFHHAGDAA